MSRSLYLLRHAKSSWDDAALDDHDRPLAGRGRRAAAAIARHMDEQGIAPELVLCSTALRARETCERLGLTEVRYERGLYAASAEELLERVRAIDENVGTAMLIGHNPGMEDLGFALTGERMEKFPTGALAVLELEDWSALRATLVAFVRPRDLEE